MNKLKRIQQFKIGLQVVVFLIRGNGAKCTRDKKHRQVLLVY